MSDTLSQPHPKAIKGSIMSGTVAVPDAQAAPAKHPTVDWGEVFSLREMGVYYALILLINILSLVTLYLGHPNYLSTANITNVMYQSSLTGIMAVAMTVILISGNFDLSVASVAALAAAVFTGYADLIGFWSAMALALTIAVCVGLLNGAIVEFLGINAFIVTLGTLTAIRGIVLIFTDGHSLSAQSPAVVNAMTAFESGRVNLGYAVLAAGVLALGFGIMKVVRGGLANMTPSTLAALLGGAAALVLSWRTGLKLPVPNPVIYMLLFCGIVWYVLTFTVVGRRLYAVGGNAEAARLSGINVVKYRLMAFVLCSGAAGFAGVLFASRLHSINPAGLQGAELTVIASAILGGTSLYGGAGSVTKAVAGALLLYSLTNGFNILNLGANYQGLIEGIVVIAAAAIYTVGDNRKKKS